MAPRSLPGVGLQAYAPKTEDNWHTWTDTNWRIVSALLQGRALSLVSAVPGSPSNGDIHILTSGANAQKIAIRDNGAWVYLTPQEGWRMYDEATKLTYQYDGSTWKASLLGLADTAAGAGTFPAVELKKSENGTANSSAATLGVLRWLGWSGSAWRSAAQMLVQTQEAWGAAAAGSAIVWQVVANGATALVSRLQLTATALLPAQTDNVMDLGSSAARWKKGWLGNLSLFPGNSVTPTINGEVTFELTNDTTLTVAVKGSDGTVRTGTITLAE